MNVISVGNFDGFEAPANPFADSDAKDTGFDTILDSIAGMMQAAPVPVPVPVAVAEVAAVTPEGWNPCIQNIKAQLGKDSGPTAVNPDTQDQWPAVGPILVNPHAKIEAIITRQPPRVPDVEKTPDIIIIPGKIPGKDPVKQPPVVVQTPDIIVVPPKDPVKQTPDIIVVPPKDPVKQTPDIIVVPSKEPVKQTPDIIVFPPKDPVKQTPDIIVVPSKDPVKQTPDIIVVPSKDPVKQTPDIIVVPSKDPVKQTPDIIVVPSKVPVKQTPDIIVVPPKDPVKTTTDILMSPKELVKTPPLPRSVVAQTPDVIVLPTKQTTAGKLPGNGQTPDIGVLPTKETPLNLPLVTMENRKSDAGLVTGDLVQVISDHTTNPVKPTVEVFIEPTAVSDATVTDRTFDPSRVQLLPKMDGDRLSGFSVAPNTVDSVVGSLNPTAAPLNFFRFTQQTNEPAPQPNVISTAINSSVAPGKSGDTSNASNLSRFWLTPEPSRTSPKTESSVSPAEVELKSISPTPKPVELRVSGDAPSVQTKPSLFEKLTTEVKTVTEATLVKPPSERRDDMSKVDGQRTDDSPQPLKFERFMTNAATDVVKVAETRTDAVADNVVDQVNPHLIELAAMANRKQEKQTLKLRLHPAELGSVEIRLERADSGAINAFFTTESDGARQALTQNMDQLRESLRESGWQVGQMEVATGGPSDGGRHQSESQSRKPSAFNEFFTPTVKEVTADDDRNSPNRLLSLLA